MASWERGRPARTKPGTASAISPTWINRERSHGSPSAWPMGFPPTGWLPAASHGSSAAAKGTGCGRDARAPRQGRPGGAVVACLAGDFSESRRAPFGKLPFARQPCSCPGVRIIRKRSNEPSWPIGNKNHVPLTWFSGLGNIDTQDRQDKQAEKLLHGKRTDSLIGCVFEVIHEPGSGCWESVLKHRRWLNSRW